MYSLIMNFSAVISAIVLAMTFIDLQGYFLKSLLTLILGSATVFLIKESTEKPRLWIFASSYAAAWISSIVFAATSIVQQIISKLSAIGTAQGAIGIGLILMLDTNPTFDAILIYVLFILPAIILFVKAPNKEIKHLRIAVIGAILAGLMCAVISWFFSILLMSAYNTF